MGFLNCKRILITGVSSKRSIAYGIAQAMYREGAELAFSYHNNKHISLLAADFNSNIVIPCDVSDDNNIKSLFSNLSKIWKTFDGFVHSIAFTYSDQLKGDYIDVVSKKGFSIAHEISVYSFLSMAKISKSMLNKNSSLVTLTYLGAERVIPNYNVMGVAKASLEANTKYLANSLGPKGIRVNAISSGPIKTLASSSIKNFKKILNDSKKYTPIRRLITIEDIGNVAAFLCSDLSSGITGEIIHVDGGFNII